MLFIYTALDRAGSEQKGTIEAVNIDVAITSLQRRGLVISEIRPEGEARNLLEFEIKFFERVTSRDIVILSRQISTLFGAQVSALRVFRLIAEEVEKPLLRRTLTAVSDDLQGGSSISAALARHPKVFSEFYIRMVQAGEESGQLNQTFEYLADHLERTNEITSKARSALIYPAFVLTTFVGVMTLMLVSVIPKLADILAEAGQEIPLYTKIVIGVSDFFVRYGFLMLIVLVLGGFFLWRYSRGPGKRTLHEIELALPFFGELYKKIYLSRVTDTLHTMLLAGIPVVRAFEVAANVVGNSVYRDILTESAEAIRGGKSIAEAVGAYEEIPQILSGMVRVGEETGELARLLDTLASFYRREVDNTINALVSLIEPALIIMLALGVGVLLASVLIPIYNISAGF